MKNCCPIYTIASATRYASAVAVVPKWSAIAISTARPVIGLTSENGSDLPPTARSHMVQARSSHPQSFCQHIPRDCYALSELSPRTGQIINSGGKSP